MEENIVEVRQVGKVGRAIDFLDEQGDLARLVTGPFEKDVRGIVFTEYKGDSSYGRPIFDLGMTIKEDGFGMFYDKVFDLKPGRANGFRVASMNPDNDMLPPQPNEQIQKWIKGKVPAEK